ncbi:MAG TPA: hypothetical protein VHG28_10220 [Longimicrobiaceae bacterium]|nr:hypothetical protein [Longimicrobiaceae bacterium]
MSPSAEWRFHLGPLDFSVGIRHFQLGGAFPEQLPALPDAAASEPRPADPAPGGRIRAAEDGVLDWESEGGTTR